MSTENKGVDNPMFESFPGIYTAASLMVTGRRMVIESLKEEPFFPDVEDLANKMWSESGIDFWDVPGHIRKVISERSKTISLILLKRAELQNKFSLSPDVAKANLIEIINSQVHPEIRLEPNNINIVWGIASFGIELNKNDFENITNFFSTTKRTTMPLGFVTGKLIGDLGPIPIIQKGKNSKTTLLHEDHHVIQSHLGYLSGTNLLETAKELDMFRVLEGKDIRHGDLDRAKVFLKSLVNEADRDLFVEFQTYIWEGSVPAINLFDEGGFGWVDMSLGSINNAIFNPNSGLSDIEQIEECFNAQHSLNIINEKRALLFRYAHHAMQQYKGPLPKHEWIAAVCFVIPPNTSIEIIKTIMLGGRHKELEENIQRTVSADLAGAIVTFARKKINPYSWGSGDPLTKENLHTFIEVVEAVFNNRKLIKRIIDNNKITYKEMVKTKESLIKYAKSSSPAGLKGKVERDLKAKLII